MRHALPASTTTRHQLDELFIDGIDYSVDFDVNWTLDEDGDGKPLGYQIDEIDIRKVKRFEADPVSAVTAYADFKADESLRDKLEAAIRDAEKRYGTLTDQANEQSQPEDRDDLDDDPDAIGGPGYGGNFYPGE